jgi:hypothetical protein
MFIGLFNKILVCALMATGLLLQIAITSSMAYMLSARYLE